MTVTNRNMICDILPLFNKKKSQAYIMNFIFEKYINSFLPLSQRAETTETFITTVVTYFQQKFVTLEILESDNQEFPFEDLH